MTRIFMNGDPVLGLVFDVAEGLNEVKEAMETAMRVHAPSTFVRLTCVREGELGHLIYLRIDDIAAIEDRHGVMRPETKVRPQEIETAVTN